jgi:Tol biopolymer transport system component
MVFVASGRDVWSILSNGEAARLFEAPDGSLIRAIDSSPDAQQVAVLLENTADEQRAAHLVLVNVTGSVVDRVELPAMARATPGVRDSTGRQAIDWSPQGDRVLVQLQTGQVFAVPAEAGGVPVTLEFDGSAGSVIAPAWSPTGQSIAFISESEDAQTRFLELLDVRSGEITTVVTPLEGRLVVDFAWLPYGVSLVFTEGGVPGSGITGIDLWRVDANGENRALVASAGTVAPVARIANLSPSPDGRSVAYVVLVPGSEGPAVDSVWVRSLASGVGFRIPLPSVASVGNISWTDEGLAISVVTRGTMQGRPPTQALLLVRRDGSMVALWAAPTPAATPTGGTPVVSAASP